ncbi:MAG: bifunctional folylpolyglutamate synthase/dihydrofolate synthase [Clostridia bacterium]|nr:bifunctional folylpolyglutamate synthase/dihydrofolate synthase [Clostridia bacterium]
MEIKQARQLFKDKVRNGSFLGLERIAALMRELGDPQNDLKYIHIAGTNGKGSTAAMLESILRTAGYSTGLYTSPALTEFNERIRSNGSMISDDELEELIPAVSEAAERVKAAGFDTVSEFEFVTALGFLYFKTKTTDIVILEVGLGGRLDATNVIRSPLAAVITAIGIDHTDRLGGTISEISAEKAAIIKPGCAVVSYDQVEEARTVIEKKAEECGTTAVFADNGKIRPSAISVDCQTFDYKDHKEISIPLIGRHQLYNAAVVLETVDILRASGFNIPEDAVRSGMKTVEWRGRLQLLGKDPPILLDGAHNVHGVTALIGSLKELFPGERFIFVCGFMADKEYEKMLEIASGICEYMITLAPEGNSRAAHSKVLAEAAGKFCEKVYAAETPGSALDKALELRSHTSLPICCFGTLYMSGDIRKYFENRDGDINE